MFEFGREIRKIFKSQGRLEVDSSLYELLNLKLLIAQGRELDIEAGRVGTKQRFLPYIEASEIWCEYARRTGDPVALKRAATAAENAGKEAKTVVEAATAALIQAETCLMTLDLYNTGDLMKSAEKLIDECRPAIHSDVALKIRFHQVEAKFMARKAMREGIDDDLDLALEAMARIDRAVEAADARAKESLSVRHKLDAAKIRFERADLLMMVAEDRGEIAIFDAVIKEFEALRARLDYASEPVTFGRVLLRLAHAYVQKGVAEGRTEIISEGIKILSLDEANADFEHAPLDYVAHKSELGHALFALAQLSASAEAYDQALKLFDLGLTKLTHKGLFVRHALFAARLTLMVTKAELDGDMAILSVVEAQLKDDLRGLKPEAEPLLWAILQAHLARLYIVRGDLTGLMRDRNEALYALSAAHDLFEEHGQMVMMRHARDLLMRVQTAL